MADFIKLVDVQPVAPPATAEVSDDEAPCKFEAKPIKSVANVYEGPYPLKALQRIRKLFMDGIFGSADGVSASAGQERMVEILKLKLKIKSRLDGNVAALGQIERETAQFRELIERRAEFIDKKLGTRREVVRYFSATTASTSTTTSRETASRSQTTFRASAQETVETAAPAVKKDEALVKTLPFFINKKDISSAATTTTTGQKSTPPQTRRSDPGTQGNEITIDSSDCDDDSDSDDESITIKNGDDEDVQFLQEIHSYFKETDKILDKFQDDSSADDADSRCFQFSMYKYDAKNPENAGKIVPKFPKNTITATSDDELEEKQKLYRQLRTKRNKERKQQAKVESTGEKSQLAVGLRKIRSDIKKLRRKRNKKLFKKAAATASTAQK